MLIFQLLKSTLQSKPQLLSILDSWGPISKNNAVATERIHVTTWTGGLTEIPTLD